jgi:ribosomal protein S14
MSYSDHKKVFKQLKTKPAKLKRFIKHNSIKERKFGANTKKCKMCGNPHAHVGKYGLDLCRKCFRQLATGLGFKKYN